MPVVDDDVSAAVAEEAEELALSDARVTTRLAGTRYRTLYVWPAAAEGSSVKEDVSAFPHVVIYDYSGDHWLEVPVDVATKSVLQFIERSPSIDGSPPLSEDEVEDVVALALADDQVAHLRDAGYTATSSSVHWGGWSGVSCITARCVVVFLESASELEPVLVQVDIGANKVVAVRDE